MVQKILFRFRYILFVTFSLYAGASQAVYLLDMAPDVDLDEKDKSAIHAVYKNYAFPSGIKFRENPEKYARMLDRYAEYAAPETVFIQDKIYKKCPHLMGKLRVIEVPTVLWELYTITQIMTDFDFGTAFFMKRKKEGYASCYQGAYFDLNLGLTHFLQEYEGGISHQSKRIILRLLEQIINLRKMENSEKSSRYMEIFRKNTDGGQDLSADIFNWVTPFEVEYNDLKEGKDSVFLRVMEIECNAIQRNKGLLVRGSGGGPLPFNSDQYYMDFGHVGDAKTDIPLLQTITPISYGYSFLSGVLFDSFNKNRSACPWIFMRYFTFQTEPNSLSRIGYALELDKKWFYESGVGLFYFPRLNDWEGVLSTGEHFHPRSLCVNAAHFPNPSLGEKEQTRQDIGSTNGPNFFVNSETAQQLPIPNFFKSDPDSAHYDHDMVTSYFLTFAKMIAEDSHIITYRGAVIASNQNPLAQLCLENQSLVFKHYLERRPPEFYDTAYFESALRLMDPVDAFNKGKGYADKKDFENAEKYYEIAANQGHKEAVEWLGYFYYAQGGDFEDLNDIEKAIKSYEKSAGYETRYKKSALRKKMALEKNRGEI